MGTSEERPAELSNSPSIRQHFRSLNVHSKFAPAIVNAGTIIVRSIDP